MPGTRLFVERNIVVKRGEVLLHLPGLGHGYVVVRGAVQALVGAVMKETRGKADAARTRALLLERLGASE